MRSETLSDAVLRKLRLAAVRPYIELHGWKRREAEQSPLAVFERDDGSLDQLLVPTNPEFADFVDQMRNVVLKLAATQSRTVQSVLADLLAQDVDTLRFSIRSSATEGGAAPLQDGLSLIEGARRSLLAAACSVLAPGATWHPRMARGEAERFVRACELGQTETGSFTVTVRCPMHTPDIQLDLKLPDAPVVPFARRATETLVSSVARLVRAVDLDQLETALGPSESEIPLTYNLCDALLRMQPDRDGAAIALAVSWAPSLRARLASRTIVLRSEHFSAIESIGRQLRGEPSQQAAPFIAQVDELRGAFGEDGRRHGEIRLTLYHEDEAITARMALNADHYALADQAHMDGSYVLIQGTLNRAPRISTVIDLAAFKILEHPPQAAVTAD